MAKQVFDLRPGKGISAGESREHLRNYSVMNPDEKKNGYYDPTRVDLNLDSKWYEEIPSGKFKENRSMIECLDNLYNELIKKEWIPQTD